MEVLAALGIGAKELFNYNRENFKFDQDQRLERETLRLEMQVKRFELFREDVRDLVTLTVDRMDVYHLVGALFLEFCIVLFCEGRVQASAPPFLLSLFLLSNAAAFIYLLLAVWLSMHASIACHSFGVRLLTRFVRLPIPSVKQLNNLRSNLCDYERQGVGNLLRLPFLDRRKHAWRPPGEADHPAPARKPEATAASADAKSTGGGAPASLASCAAEPVSPELSANVSVWEPPDSRGTSPSPRGSASGGGELHSPRRRVRLPTTATCVSFDGDEAVRRERLQTTATYAPLDAEESSARPPTVSHSSGPLHAVAEVRRAPGPDTTLLPEEDEDPLGGEDLLASGRGLNPERHVQLFRRLQTKWQCYDAYCRVCMGLGVNQLLQSLSYFAICHTLVENHAPSTGFCLIVIFQCTTVALAVLDLAGMKKREILAIQIIGTLPCCLSAIGITIAKRSGNGVLQSDHKYFTAPLAFLFQAFWLELWLRISAPVGEFSALPRRFRQVLFLDVFGDTSTWREAGDGEDVGDAMRALASEHMGHEAAAWNDAAEEASMQLDLAQSALRRWCAVPSWGPSAAQAKEVERLCKRLQTAGASIQCELDRNSGARAGMCEFANFEAKLRRWKELSVSERLSDPLAGCLLGPFVHDSGYTDSTYYYDLDSQQCLFQDTPESVCAGGFVLTLSAANDIITDLEQADREMIEMRILHDLQGERRRRRSSASDQLGNLVALTPSMRRRRHPGAFAELRHRAKMAAATFPNLKSLFKNGCNSQSGAMGDDDGIELQDLAAQEGGASASPPSRCYSPGADMAGAEAGGDGRWRGCGPRAADPTLVAMAGRHAQHFVPEQLPWKVLKFITRVLQTCWLLSGLLILLKITDIYVLDFQRPEGLGGEEGRVFCVLGQRSFDVLQLDWPNGHFFNPRGVSCGDGSAEGELLVSSPFALYRSRGLGSPNATLDEIHEHRLPASTVALCAPTRLEPAASSASRSDGAPAAASGDAADSSPRCILAAPVPATSGAGAVADNGRPELVFWPLGEASTSVNAVVLLIDGAPWTLLAGAVTSCSAVRRLLREEPTSSSCLLLAGWDGALLMIAGLPLLGGPGTMPGNASVVRPRLDVPLDGDASRRGIAALHLAQGSSRLWVLFERGRLDAWDLLEARRVGTWNLQFSAVAPEFEPSGLCEDGSGDLYTVGRSRERGPQLVRWTPDLGLDMRTSALLS